MGIKERKEREKEQRKQTIVDAAEKIFFSKGIDNATMDDVAEKAELSKGTLYLYFKNKDELFWAIHLRGLSLLSEYMRKVRIDSEGKNGAELTQEAGLSYLDYAIKHKNYFDIMMKCEGQCDDQYLGIDENFSACKIKSEESIAYLIEIIMLGQADGSISTKRKASELAIFLWGGLSGMIQLYHTDKLKNIELNDGLDKDEMLKNFINFQFESIRAGA